MRPSNLEPIPVEQLLCEWKVPLDSRLLYSVYLHWTVDTEELFYVGKGKDNRPYSYKGRNLYWRNIVKKHGIKIIIHASSLNEEEAFLEECRLIEKYTPRANLGAPLLGGSGLQQQTPEANSKRQASCIKAWTPEKKIARSLQYSGDKNPFYGRMHSQETINKIKSTKFSPIECVNLDTQQYVCVNGTREASRLTGIDRRQIGRILKNTLTHYHNWTFKRL